MTVSSTIASFVCSLRDGTIPEPVEHRLRACLLNGYGIALGGLPTHYHRVAAQAALAAHGEVANGVTLLGDGRKAGIDAALLSNAALFHGLAQEDTCGTVHVGAIVMPMLTAMAETGRYDGKRFLPALLAGYEVAGLFDVAYGSLTAPLGLRASPLYGTLGAAAAAAAFMGLGEDGIASALANAAAFTGGTLQAFAEGTDEWRYQVGIAARNGLTAAALARAGSVTAPHAFEGNAGFLRAYVKADCDLEKLLEGLGKRWAIERVTFKPYPVCAFNQTPVQAALTLREKLAGRYPHAITVRMNPYETSYAGMLAKGPFSTISGTLMSIPFCVAVTLVRGAPTITNMTTYDDWQVAALIERINVVSDQDVPNLSTVIDADVGDGTRIVHKQTMTAADYAYDWHGVSRLVRRVGATAGLDPSLYDQLESIVRSISGQTVQDIIKIFAAARAMAQ
ncbi:MmgE/PrpD family protein [Bosea sp. (in: a-proteobacteria)]|uniref:MmgE/PrpD family protein n=1 Tax=Bosea sp. (in: a-proteobacteria) TaxID=1871050 RepID=UPI003B3B8268